MATTTATDKLLSTQQVADRLGGMHRENVCVLIRTGKLGAKKVIVRGRSTKRPTPRYMVPESELRRYIRELPDAVQTEAPPEANHRAQKRPTRRIRAGDVIEFVR